MNTFNLAVAPVVDDNDVDHNIWLKIPIEVTGFGFNEYSESLNHPAGFFFDTAMGFEKTNMDIFDGSFKETALGSKDEFSLEDLKNYKTDCPWEVGFIILIKYLDLIDFVHGNFLVTKSGIFILEKNKAKFISNYWLESSDNYYNECFGRKMLFKI